MSYWYELDRYNAQAKGDMTDCEQEPADEAVPADSAPSSVLVALGFPEEFEGIEDI